MKVEINENMTIKELIDGCYGTDCIQCMYFDPAADPHCLFYNVPANWFDYIRFIKEGTHE